MTVTSVSRYSGLEGGYRSERNNRCLFVMIKGHQNNSYRNKTENMCCGNALFYYCLNENLFGIISVHIRFTWDWWSSRCRWTYWSHRTTRAQWTTRYFQKINLNDSIACLEEWVVARLIIGPCQENQLKCLWHSNNKTLFFVCVLLSTRKTVCLIHTSPQEASVFWLP